MQRRTRPTVDELLLEVARHVVGAPGAEPWNYGWSQPEYRGSARAALAGSGGPVTIAPAWREKYENAVGMLMKESDIRERWGEEEFWGIVAAVVVAAAEAADPKDSIEVALSHLRTVGTTLVLMPVANVAAPDAPVTVADCVIGRVDEALADQIVTTANDRSAASGEQLQTLAAAYGSMASPLVVAATWLRAQSGLAVDQAEGRLRKILDVALLLFPSPGDIGMYSLRGSTNRPGVRGVAIDRRALEDVLVRAGASREIAAEIPVMTQDGGTAHVRWHSADPVPLPALLADEQRRALIDHCVRDSSPVARRVRVAARWYAEAHWAIDEDDAVLALGIAMDALLGARSGLPGRAMRERFALLESATDARVDRASRYAELFSARSAVAHGGTSSSLEKPGFVRGFAEDVGWATYRLLAFEQLFDPRSENDIAAGFESLRWGTASWEASPAG